MSLNVPRGSRCFVDANILFYHFVGYPAYSNAVSALMARIGADEFTAHTSAGVVADALHRVMLSEIQMQYKLPKPLPYVQRHPGVISKLTAYPLAVKTARTLGIVILPILAEDLDALPLITSSCSLLTNDALIVSNMRRNNIDHLVTNDDDFDNVPGITVWKPR